jgi:ferrous iron transport protein A
MYEKQREFSLKGVDMFTKNLTHLQEGERARVASLLNTGGMKRRLQDLGLVTGTQVQCIQKSPYGDPVAYGIRGAVIALRTEDARRVLVFPLCK